MSESSIRRRDFVAGATAATAGLALTTDALAGEKNSLHKLTQADFAQFIGQSFAVVGTSEQGTRQRGSLVLKEVVAHDTAKDLNRPSVVRKEAFSLRFESRDLSLQDGTHTLAAGGFSAKSVDLQEMLDQREPGLRHYEAVFN